MSGRQRALECELNRVLGGHQLFTAGLSTWPWGNCYRNTLLAEQFESVIIQKEESHFPNHQHRFCTDYAFLEALPRQAQPCSGFETRRRLEVAAGCCRGSPEEGRGVGRAGG